LMKKQLKKSQNSSKKLTDFPPKLLAKKKVQLYDV